MNSSKQALVFTCLLKKSFENTIGKVGIVLNKQFFHFPQQFLHFLLVFITENCCLKSLSVWKSLKFVTWERFNYSFLQGSTSKVIFNSLPKNKFLDWSKSETFANDKFIYAS